MNRKILNSNFDWQLWSSTEKDVKNFDSVLAANILLMMYIIHTFENELLILKKKDCVWGPVHSSVGQEAVAAAAIAAIKKDDKIAGSHRAHHQFLSKALQYVLPEDWNPLKNDFPESGFEVMCRTLAEIMGLAPSYCGGRGGSMHLRYAEAGILGTNAIVAGGIPMATGAAYAEKYRGSNNIVVCFFGDGAVNQGVFHESANMAGLWKLPIIYFIENNKYAVGTHSENASAVKDLSLRAVSYNIKARIVAGHDVIAIYEVVKEAVMSIRRGEGPWLIEVKCYRYYHHAGDKPGSAYGYRSKEEETEYLEKDAMKNFQELLLSTNKLNNEEIERIHEIALNAVHQAVEYCTDTDCTGGETKLMVRPELLPDPETVSYGLHSDGRELEGIQYSEYEDFNDFDEIKYSDAIAHVTGRWMEKDKNVLLFGEEVANFGGGAYGATKNLPDRFPQQVINTPISEAGFTGLALGTAMSGLKPIIEIMFPDFSLTAADQLFNQIAKVRYIYGGTADIPIVVRTRIASGCGYGGQHSMDPVGLFSLFPGWRIVAPGNAFDYIGLFNTAMCSMDPVLIIEHHSLYNKKFTVPKGNLDYFIPLGKAKIIAQGKDVTVLTYASMTARMQNLKSELDARGITIEIIDLRTLDLPNIDYETIGVSLRKTGAIATVEEAASAQGIGCRIAAEITERFFDFLDAPPVCFASLDVPSPVSKVLESASIISDKEIIERIEAVAKRR